MRKFRSVVNEVLGKGKNADCGEYVHDFVHSKNKQFKGKSKKARIKQALGACYAAKREETEVNEISKKKVVAYLDKSDGAPSPKHNKIKRSEGRSLAFRKIARDPWKLRNPAKVAATGPMPKNEGEVIDKAKMFRMKQVRNREDTWHKITKAIDAHKKTSNVTPIKKEETLDEIGNTQAGREKLSDYIQGAHRNAIERQKDISARGLKKDLDSNIRKKHNRAAGITRAAMRLAGQPHREETINELGKETLRSYHQKVNDHDLELQVNKYKKTGSAYHKRKATNRFAGLKKSDLRLAGTFRTKTGDKSYHPEETEVNEISKKRTD